MAVRVTRAGVKVDFWSNGRRAQCMLFFLTKNSNTPRLHGNHAPGRIAENGRSAQIKGQTRNSIHARTLLSAKPSLLIGLFGANLRESVGYQYFTERTVTSYYLVYGSTSSVNSGYFYQGAWICATFVPC